MSVQATFTATLVDEWVQCGVTDAVVCPGSRSTPLALALADRLRVHVRLDERSAAFFALGLSMANGRPTVICTTSGTAAAELHAAVAEAHHACVPLIVCTADRPPELQQVGASQTIDQVGLFTTATRWANAPGVPEDSQRNSWRPLAARAWAESLHGPRAPGPVHLNLAFREPLVGEPGPLPERSAPSLVRSPLTPDVSQPIDVPGRGLIIVGAGSATPELVQRLGATLGWPVLADPRSGCRLEGSIAAADAIVRAEGIPHPDAILILGAPWLSKALMDYVSTAASAGASVTTLDPRAQWVDPTHVVSEIIQADPNLWLAAVLPHATVKDPEWLPIWQFYEAKAQETIAATLGDALTEPQVARTVFTYAAATRSVLFTAASMPMRDVEWFAPALAAPPVVMANRGANGIDGVVSTALGVAATGQPTIALMGDLAFLHDVSGLVHAAELPCTFVVVDNGGGGIFSFLPQAGALNHERFEQLFGTPPAVDISAVARGFWLTVHDVSTLDELKAALSLPPSVIRVIVPGRRENVALHDDINQAVARALG